MGLKFWPKGTFWGQYERGGEIFWGHKFVWVLCFSSVQINNIKVQFTAAGCGLKRVIKDHSTAS